jgi:hypothetical protein
VIRTRVLPLKIWQERGMFNSESHRQSGNLVLPKSSWAIPAIAGFMMLLAVAQALAQIGFVNY